MPGERTGQRFRPGDRVRVRRVRADLESQEIDFVPVDEKPSRKTARPGR
jgi:ribonuclease R